MPQEFHVLRCYSCSTFQVHIVKKVNKWQCKMCNEKQSLKMVYGRGTGKECRLHVQKLNTLHLSSVDQTTENYNQIENTRNEYEDLNEYFKNPETAETSQIEEPSTSSSKWSRYLEPKQKSQPSDDEDDYSCAQPVKRKKTFNTRQEKNFSFDGENPGFTRINNEQVPAHNKKPKTNKFVSDDTVIQNHADSVCRVDRPPLQTNKNQTFSCQENKQLSSKIQSDSFQSSKWGKYVSKKDDFVSESSSDLAHSSNLCDSNSASDEESLTFNAIGKDSEKNFNWKQKPQQIHETQSNDSQSSDFPLKLPMNFSSSNNFFDVEDDFDTDELDQLLPF